MVAITLVTVAILGLLGELASYIKQQHLEKTQATALHLANGVLESAQQDTYAALTSPSNLGSHTGVVPVAGINYTETTTVQLCSATDGPSSCTTPSGSTASVVHAGVTVAWTANGKSHSIQLQRGYADNSTSTISTSTSPLGSCGGGGTTLVSGSLSLSPSSVTIDSSGHPTSDVTVTLTQTGLSSATCVPLTYSDDTGSHQVTMTQSGTGFTVTIPKASITRAVTSSGSVTFTATVPGSQAVPSKTLTLTGLPTFGTCQVQVAGLGLNIITLALLSRNSLLAATLTCTTTNLSATDTVQDTYASGSTTKTVNLTSTNGSTWTATLPAGTAMVSSGTSESMTFSLKRASDNATATKALTVTLA